MGSSASVNHHHLHKIHYHTLDENDKHKIINSFKEFYTNDFTKLFVHDDETQYYIIVNTFKICVKYEHNQQLIDILLTLNRPFVFDDPYLSNSKGFWVKFIYTK